MKLFKDKGYRVIGWQGKGVQKSTTLQPSYPTTLSSGFTLVELMVVIAIIAILTGIIITGLVGSKAKARDAERASDLSQISLALEQYFDRCDQYPASSPSIFTTPLTSIIAGCPTSPQVSLDNFISKIPTDPTNSGSYVYNYVTNSSNTDYVLYVTFEASNSVLNQSAPNPSWYPSSPSGNFDCSDATDFHYCVRPN